MTAWSIGSSVPRAKDQIFGLNLVMWPHPGAQLSLTAESAASSAMFQDWLMRRRTTPNVIERHSGTKLRAGTRRSSRSARFSSIALQGSQSTALADEVTVGLSRDQALVLFEWLARTGAGE